MRLRVGDIEMDSETGVSFGGPPRVAPTAAVADADVSWSARLAAAPRWVWAAVSVASASVVVLAALTAWATQVWVLVIPGLLCVRLCLYAAVLAAAPRRTIPNPATAGELRDLMAAVSASGAATVDDLMGCLGWEERRVVAAIVGLVQRGELEEDLDVETGRWTYRPTAVLSGVEARATLSAQDRLRAIETEHAKGVHVEN